MLVPVAIADVDDSAPWCLRVGDLALPFVALCISQSSVGRSFKIQSRIDHLSFTASFMPSTWA